MTAKHGRYVRRHGRGFRAVLSIDGRRHVGPTYRTPEQAATYAARVKAVRASDEPLTLRGGLDLVLDELRASNARPATIDYYRNHFRILTREDGGWGPLVPLHRITVEQIQRYAAKRLQDGISPGTITGKELQVLDRILRLAVKRGHLAANVMARVSRPKAAAKRFSHLSAERVSEIVGAIRSSAEGRRRARDADIVSLLFLTGLRRAEASRLTVGAVDFERGELRIEGKNRPRHVPISAECRAVLERLVLGRTTAEGDEPLIGSIDLIERVFSRWRKRLGEPRLTPHVLRHGFGTALARAGVSPYVIQSLMGHGSLQMSLRYIHSQSDQDRAGVEMVTLKPTARPSRGGSRRGERRE